MTTSYTTDTAWGGKITLEYNNSYSGANAHEVLIITQSIMDEVVHCAVKGEKGIRDFLYNFAVIGGIIKEGETLRIDEPSDKDVPADGVYKLTGASKDRPIALVQGGRVLIPQPEHGTIVDFTDTYLSAYSKWELTPMEKVDRDA